MIRVCEVRRREAARMAQLLGVWEASVRATRLFLSEPVSYTHLTLPTN